MSKYKVRIFACILVLAVIGFGLAIVYITIADSSAFRAFKASKPLKSNLKSAAEIGYKDYVGDDEEIYDGSVSVEWVLNHWFEGFEPVTVFYEDIAKPYVDEELGLYLSTQQAIIEYGKDLLKVEDVEVVSVNIIDEDVGCVTIAVGDRTYLLCMCITDETEEGMCTIFHSEVISHET